MGESTGIVFLFSIKLMNQTISIVIIGHNTSSSLKLLLGSINQLNASLNNLEIVYIDDGSNDNSFELFNQFNLQYKKKSKKLEKNMGRVFATQEGIDLSSGDWLLFVRSNEMLTSNIILEYIYSINNFNALAFSGIIKYQSNDQRFENYLNNKKRGIARYRPGDIIHYKFLLFNNSIIHSSVFGHIRLNQKLQNYGGEELDFSFRVNQKFPNQIKACPAAVVLRNNYPCFDNHLKRLYEFGKYNFLYLNNQMKKDVVYCNGLLFPPLKPIIYFVDYMFFCFSWLNINNINFYIIRVRLLCAILKGYHKGS